MNMVVVIVDACVVSVLVPVYYFAAMLLPVSDPDQAQEHVRCAVQLPHQPIRVHRAVRIGGGVPTIRIRPADLAGEIEPRGPRRTHIAGFDANKMDIGSVLTGQFGALVFAGVEHHDDGDRDGNTQRGGHCRGQTVRETLPFVVRWNDYGNLVVGARRCG